VQVFLPNTGFLSLPARLLPPKYQRMYKAYIKSSPRDDKRYRVVMSKDGSQHSHDFGKPGATTYKDGASEDKRKNYLKRHSQMGEDWTQSGIHSAGFWSRWLLWEKRTLRGAAKHIQDKFNLKVEIDGRIS